jgi:hypothetical protein
MKGEQAMNMFNLVVKNNLLPTKIEDLAPLSFIGNQAVKFYRETIKNFDNLRMSEKQRKAVLEDGQNAGNMLLDVELQIGELAVKEKRAKPKIDPRSAGRNGNLLRGGVKPSGKPPKHERLRLKEKHMQDAQALFNAHEEAIKEGWESPVDKVRKQAKKANDIPTKTAAINEVRYQKEKERRKKAEGKRQKTRIEWAADQLGYIRALDKCAKILPIEPPKDWNEDALKEATIKARIIIKRLEVFNE